MKYIKLAYIGGGSKAWARVFMNDLALTPGLSGEIALYDIDTDAARRNQKIGGRINEAMETLSKWNYVVYEDLEEALRGADFVACSILPGTFDEMESDVHAPERFGIYQSVGDTVGPGGVLRAMRTVPIYEGFAKAIRKCCPDAWVINLTNPMTACVKTLYDVFPEIKAFGCCHEVFHAEDFLCCVLKEELGVPRPDRHELTVKRTAKVLGLTDYLDRMPRALSGGQRQRVAVGRAIIRKVGVFLMDEPLSNLDAKQRVTMRSEITQIHRETGATTIYVTHDQTEAMTMADRIVVMRDGYIQQVGTPYDLYFKPANVFVAGFIGEPPMNFVRGTVTGGCIDFGGIKLDLSHKLGSKTADYEGKEIVFGFRPEAIALGKQENAYVIDCSVELTEMLGDNTNVYINVQDAKAILKVDPHDTPEVDSDITFSIPYDSVYLFDGQTEFVI